MKFSDFTKEQQLAITAKGSNIIVSAGAGSGKTAVLSQRVLHFIQNEGYKIDEFLILTFTKLAAGEMKERIRKALTEANLDDANNIDNASITTFDAYALSIVQKYHFTLKILPNIKIIDSNIISVKKRKIIEEIFNGYYERHDKLFLEMINKYCFKDDIELRELVLKFSDKANLEIDTDLYLNNFIKNYYSEDIINFFIEHYVNLFSEKINNLRSKINNLPNICPNKRVKITYQDMVKEYLNLIINAKDYDEYTLGISSENFPRIPNGLEEKDKELITDFKNDYNELKELIGKLPRTKKDFFDYFKTIVPYVEILIEIVKKLNSNINEYKKKYGVYEFQDIAKMALKLLEGNNNIKDDIKSKLKMIMIDEYQDTSILQEKFISLIENNNVYMVGDIKQSIYRFRNAKSEIFANKYQEYKKNNGGIAIDLNKNFRSRREVLDDINYLFKQIMTYDIGGADYQKYHIIEYGNKNYLKANVLNDSKNSTFIIYPKSKNRQDIHYIEAQLIANDIINKINSKYQVYEFSKKLNKPILRNCKFSDFCILMDRGSAFDIYRKVFNDYKIPLYVENDENIAKNDVVLILTNLLRIIKAINNNSYDSFEFKKAFLSVARSYLYQYSDQLLYEIATENNFKNDKIVDEIRNIIYSNFDLTVSQLFKKIIFEINVYEKLVRIGNINKNEKYLDTFLEMFNEMSNLDYSIDDFITYLESVDDYNLKITLSSSNENIDSVKIMNIHKSKGLEFSIVYFSGLKNNFNRQESKNNFGITNNYGLILPPSDPDKISIVKDVNKYYDDIDDISEKIRLLYVSLTRTKEKMIFLLEEPNYNEKKNQYDVSKAVEMCRKNSLVKNDFSSLEFVFNEFKVGNINSNILEMISMYLQISLPYSFLIDNYQKKISWTFSTLKDRIIRNEEFIKPLIKSIKDDNDEIMVKNIFKLYREKFLTVTDLIEALTIINYTISSTFNNNLENDDFSFNWVTKIVMERKIPSIEIPDLFNQFTNAYYKYYEHQISFSEFNLFCRYLHYNIINEKNGDLQNYATNSYKEIIDFSTLNYSSKNSYTLIKDLVKKIFDDYKNNILSRHQLLLFTQLSFIKMPYIDLFENRIRKNSKIDINCLNEIFEIIGIVPNSRTKLFLNNYLNNCLSQKEIDDFINDDFYKKYDFNDRFYETILKDKELKGDILFANLLRKYQIGEYDIEKLEKMLDCIDYQIKINFRKMDENHKWNPMENDIYNIIEEKGEILKNREKMMNFYSFIYPFYSYCKFNIEIGDLEKDNVLDEYYQNEIIHEKIQVIPINIDSRCIKRFAPSKKMEINTKMDIVDFGTKLHLLMEVIDFKNPDYSLATNDLEKKIIIDFLNTPFMKNVNNGRIYKEYAYYDEENDIKGVIDLMIVYNDYIDIIDYKSKKINDNFYKKQINNYANFISKLFGKRVEAYLYSLLTTEFIKVI